MNNNQQSSGKKKENYRHMHLKILMVFFSKKKAT